MRSVTMTKKPDVTYHSSGTSLRIRKKPNGRRVAFLHHCIDPVQVRQKKLCSYAQSHEWLNFPQSRTSIICSTSYQQDPYVSEYFRRAVSLKDHFHLETPARASELP